MTYDEKIMLEETLVSEKELSDFSFEGLKNHWHTWKRTYLILILIDSLNNMYLTVDSFLDINSIIIGSNAITLRRANVKPYGYDKMDMDKKS